MRYRVIVSVLVSGCLVLAACSKSKVDQMESRLDLAPACTEFGFPDLPGVAVDGNQVRIEGIHVEGKTTVKCESQIVSVGPELLPGLKPSPYPNLPEEELELTEEAAQSLTLLRWLGDMTTERLSSRYYVLPGQVFQCDVEDTAAITCDGWVSSSYLVSTFEEIAYEFNGKMAMEVSGLGFDFSKKTKDTEKESQASSILVGSKTRWVGGVPNIWSSMLVRRDVYERRGRATICYHDLKYTCRDAVVKLQQTQDFLITGTVGSWRDTFNNYLEAVGHTLQIGSTFTTATEPSVAEFLTDKLVKGSKRAFLSPSGPQVMLRWTDSYSVMHRRDGSGQISASIETVVSGSYLESVARGKEIAGHSEGWIFYPAQSREKEFEIIDSRCFMVKTVGGLNNTQLSGVSLKEVCN